MVAVSLSGELTGNCTVVDDLGRTNRVLDKVVDKDDAGLETRGCDKGELSQTAGTARKQCRKGEKKGAAVTRIEFEKGPSHMERPE